MKPSNISQALTKVTKKNVFVFLYFVVINLPLLILTWDTKNWSDDFQLTNLYAVKAKFSSFWPLILEKTGSHFSPIYNIFNYLITSITVHPAFFHSIVVLCHILTAFFIFLIVKKYYARRWLAILAGTLFSVNYYIGFKSLTWNCFHSHVTNTFTGTVSIYYLLCYFCDKNKTALPLSALFLLLSVLNFESGFIFCPILIGLAMFLKFKDRVETKKLLKVFVVYAAVMLIYPLGSYFTTKETFPLLYRFRDSDPRWGRNMQNYAFLANDLLVKSSGLAFVYDKVVFDPLRSNQELKTTMSKVIKGNNHEALKEIPRHFKLILLFLAATTVFCAVFLLAEIWRRIDGRTRGFLYIYICAFLIYIFIFYRVDIANAIAVFSSVVMADLIFSFLEDKRQNYKRVGWGILAVYMIVTAATILDRFEDCYEKSFAFFPKNTLQGTQRVYDAMNKNLGHLADRGLLLFTHDYSPYARENGERRIGSMVWLGDFVCYNATVFYKELLKTDVVAAYKNRSFTDFVAEIRDNPKNQRIYVESREDALRYLREHKVDLDKTDALYMFWDYKIENLKDAL